MMSMQSGVSTAHTGAGVARRTAYHDRRRLEATETEATRVRDEVTLEEEARRGDEIRLMSAEDVEVPPPGANYFVVKASETKREQREKRSRPVPAEAVDDVPTAASRRVRSRLMARCDNQGRAGGGRDEEGVTTGGGFIHAADWPQPSGGVSLRAVLGGDEIDNGAADTAIGDQEPIVHPHGPSLSRSLVYVRNRLKEFLAEQAQAGVKVPMMQTPRGEYPTMRWTISFGKWLGCTRSNRSNASLWDVDGQVR